MTDLSFPHLRGNLYGFAVGLFLFYLSIQLHQLTYGTVAKEWRHGGGILGVATWMFGSGFAHEGIHGFAWKLCKNRYSELRIKFGFSWKAGGFFTHFTGPMPIQPYIIGIAAPGVLLGLLPVMSGLVSGHISVTIFGAFNLAISGGDFAVLWVTRQVPKNRQVMDHSTRMGFLMLDVPSTPVVGPAVSSLQR